MNGSNMHLLSVQVLILRVHVSSRILISPSALSSWAMISPSQIRRWCRTLQVPFLASDGFQYQWSPGILNFSSCLLVTLAF